MDRLKMGGIEKSLTAAALNIIGAYRCKSGQKKNRVFWT
jgi:hypothetical protein